MRKVLGTLVGLVLLLGGLLVGCGRETKEAHTVGAPTKTVGQLKEWPQGFEPGGGGFREVDMPPAARKNVVEASREAEGSQSYFGALRRY
ncbi:MAG: hypothetical protein ACE5JQ_00475 [Candidatus Methylomirabilales bacterium]